MKVRVPTGLERLIEGEPVVFRELAIAAAIRSGFKKPSNVSAETSQVPDLAQRQRLAPTPTPRPIPPG